MQNVDFGLLEIVDLDGLMKETWQVYTLFQEPVEQPLLGF